MHDSAVYKVMIAEDHDIFRHGLKNLLNKYSFLICTGEAANGKDLLELIKKDPPDLVFMDLHMAGGHGIAASEEIIAKYPSIKIVVLSSFDDAITIDKMMIMGVKGYMTKNISIELLDKMFEKVLSGNIYLCPVAYHSISKNQILPSIQPHLPNQLDELMKKISSREQQVMKRIAEVMTQKEIAAGLGLSPRTIETYKESLMKKLKAKNTAEVISIAFEYKLI